MAKFKRRNYKRAADGSISIGGVTYSKGGSSTSKKFNCDGVYYIVANSSGEYSEQGFKSYGIFPNEGNESYAFYIPLCSSEFNTYKLWVMTSDNDVVKHNKNIDYVKYTDAGSNVFFLNAITTDLMNSMPDEGYIYLPANDYGNYCYTKAFPYKKIVKS